MESISLHGFQFDLDQCPCPATLICGKRFSGKTRLATSLVAQLNCERWIVFCGSDEARCEWTKGFPHFNVYGWDEKGREVFASKMKEQQKLAQQAKHENRDLTRAEMVGFIFEDLSNSLNFCQSPELKYILAKGRRCGALPIVIDQTARNISPSELQNFDIVIQMRCFRETRDRLFQVYGIYLDRHKYEKLYHQIINLSTPDNEPLYYGLVINGIGNAHGIDEYYQVIQAST